MYTNLWLRDKLLVRWSYYCCCLLLYLNKVESWNRIWRNERLASMAGEFVVVVGVVDLDLGVVDVDAIIIDNCCC